MHDKFDQGVTSFTLDLGENVLKGRPALSEAWPELETARADAYLHVLWFKLLLEKRETGGNSRGSESINVKRCWIVN